MLVLSRNVGEEILLRLPDGRTVRVLVLALQSNRHNNTCVRLGIAAPDEVRIYRAEAQQRYGLPPATMPAAEIKQP